MKRKDCIVGVEVKVNDVLTVKLGYNTLYAGRSGVINMTDGTKVGVCVLIDGMDVWFSKNDLSKVKGA